MKNIRQPSIYQASNYYPFCSLGFRLMARFKQFLAKLFPPDFVYVVHCGIEKKDGDPGWIEGIFLHQYQAEIAYENHLKMYPDGWAYWEQRGLVIENAIKNVKP